MIRRIRFTKRYFRVTLFTCLFDLLNLLNFGDLWSMIKFYVFINLLSLFSRGWKRVLINIGFGWNLLWIEKFFNYRLLHCLLRIIKLWFFYTVYLSQIYLLTTNHFIIWWGLIFIWYINYFCISILCGLQRGVR